jgi:hypothetical protein
MGHIIPAGTGYTLHRRVDLKPLVEPIPAEEPAALEPLSLTGQPLAG